MTTAVGSSSCCPRRTSKRPETVCTVVAEPSVLTSTAALRHVHPIETFPAVAAAAAAAPPPLRLGGSAAPYTMSIAAATAELRLGGTGTAVPSSPPHPPRAGVLVLLPRRCRRARLPDGVRPLNAANQQVARQPSSGTDN